jgi:hypothetical protein
VRPQRCCGFGCVDAVVPPSVSVRPPSLSAAPAPRRAGVHVPRRRHSLHDGDR